MRLIDADRLLEERRLRFYYHLPNGDTAIPIIDIKHAPTVNNGGWIPVGKRLPKNYENVIVHQTGNNTCSHVIVGYHYGNDVFESWFAYNGEEISSVTHWIPFPEPPQMD